MKKFKYFGTILYISSVISILTGLHYIDIARNGMELNISCDFNISGECISIYDLFDNGLGW